MDYMRQTSKALREILEQRNHFAFGACSVENVLGLDDMTRNEDVVCVARRPQECPDLFSELEKTFDDDSQWYVVYDKFGWYKSSISASMAACLFACVWGRLLPEGTTHVAYLSVPPPAVSTRPIKSLPRKTYRPKHAKPFPYALGETNPSGRKTT